MAYHDNRKFMPSVLAATDPNVVPTLVVGNVAAERIFSAWLINDVCMWDTIDQAIIRREYKSMATSWYSHLDRVRIGVMSKAHAWLGAAGSKYRSPIARVLFSWKIHIKDDILTITQLA